MIDAALADCKDFDSFLAALKAVGVEVKRGKHRVYTGALLAATYCLKFSL